MKSVYQSIIIIFLISLSSCVPFNLMDHLNYNESVQLYEYRINEYRSVFIRNDKGELINRQNIDSFRIELENNNKRYSFDQCFEKDPLKASDLNISRLYSEVNSEMNNHDFPSAMEKMKQLENLYPDIKKFSDHLFLESVVYARQDSLEMANEKFREFLNYSSGSYSKKFRGYRDADLNDSLFVVQRRYASDYLQDPQSAGDYESFKKIEPRYHYNSFKPGYLMNPENSERGVKWLTNFMIGLDNSHNIAGGLQVYRKITNGMDVNMSILSSGETRAVGAALPVQLYKSIDDRLGLKVTPFINYIYTDSLTVDDVKYESDESFFNFGAKISLGYYLLPKVSLGAYYKYNFRNKNNPVLASSNDIYLWWNNEIDVSLYYDIFKNFSLKTGMYNGDFVGGFFWSGWEISYNISNPGLVIKVDMY
jgi:hypothetical protein